MPEVPYTKKTITQCLCYGCAVQEKSACAKEKDNAASDAFKKGELPAVADLPGLYCATGVATCTDLDFTGKCPCSDCAVYLENSIGQWKYCERGSAAQIG